MFCVVQVCVSCGVEFDPYPVTDGVRLNLRGRKQCLGCRPLRHLTRPRRNVARERRSKTCEACGALFPAKIEIDGVVRSMYRRRFCLACSPFGAHNTSAVPPGALDAEGLKEHRRRRRNAKNYRSQKKRRRNVKAELVAARGGRCADCGYTGTAAALDFHHRDPKDKEFAIGGFNGSRRRLLGEVEKCDLLCANCHRLRHQLDDRSAKGGPVVEFRRRAKLRAVAHMGGACFGCGREGLAAIFDFHHWEAGRKDFGIGQDGIPRPWSKITAELAKCVLLCANCHREVHAGVRELDEGLLGLAEDALRYVA